MKLPVVYSSNWIFVKDWRECLCVIVIDADWWSTTFLQCIAWHAHNDISLIRKWLNFAIQKQNFISHTLEHDQNKNIRMHPKSFKKSAHSCQSQTKQTAHACLLSFWYWWRAVTMSKHDYLWLCLCVCVCMQMQAMIRPMSELFLLFFLVFLCFLAWLAWSLSTIRGTVSEHKKETSICLAFLFYYANGTFRHCT